ncbi:MAG TPA: protein kinase [Vicinamibacterales bacterium]|jgi:serine/threonine-protein kinase|nr:protein kinase [Vicinamibacterales bacterium]
MIGETVGPYRIIAKHGEGGMGVVYRAEDPRLNRIVALKALPARLGADEVIKARFRREARAASAVDHPNICSIYGFEETADGRQFIVMPLYEGESLKQRLAARRLSVDESLDIATQTAEGLAAAHARGVIHRDIKPSNLLITPEGQVKIVDFGLATVSDHSRLTIDGDLMGTPAYMSPEQTRGEETDQRTDIWSLGVVLYEMLTGHLPFRGDHVEAAIYAIRHDPPAPLSDMTTGPSALDAVVTRALAKNPADRFQSAAEMSRALAAAHGNRAADTLPATGPRTLVAAVVALALVSLLGWTGWTLMHQRSAEPADTARPNVQSIAVLPFRNRGASSNFDYVGPGLADVLAATLTKAALFEVRSPVPGNSEASDADQLALARSLGVDAVLTGSYQVEGSMLSLSYRLLDTRSEVNLAGDVIEVAFDRAIDAERRLAVAVVGALRPALPQLQQRVAANETDEPQAFQAFLRSQSQLELFWQQPNASQLDAVRQSLEQAVRYDPKYTQAIVQLVVVDWVGAFWGYRSSPDGLERAERLADEAIAADPAFADAYAARSLLRFQKGALDAARADLRAALDRSSQSALTYYAAGWYFLGRGFNDLSVTAFQRAHELHPELVRRELGIAYRFQGNLVRAAQRYRDDLKTYPGDVQTQSNLAVTMLALGDTKQATELADGIVEANPSDPSAQWVATLMRAERGDARAVQAWLRRYHDAYWNDAGYCADVAAVWALSGDARQTVVWLRRARDLGFHNYPFLQSYRFFDRVRLDPGFVSFLNELKGEWDASWEREQKDPLMRS